MDDVKGEEMSLDEIMIWLFLFAIAVLLIAIAILIYTAALLLHVRNKIKDFDWRAPINYPDGHKIRERE
jgi:cell division protein FtsL